MRECTSAKQHEIKDLPEEILREIFRYLSSSDIKVVRLVSKSWFDACNVPSFLDCEVLSCTGLHQLSDIYELIGKSDRRFLNLRFHNVKFVNSRNLFWEDNGYRIRLIDFTDCEFHDDVFEKIIINCEGLLHVSLVYSFQYNDRASLSLGVDLEKLSKLGITRENLKSLEIDLIESSCLSNQVLHYLFSMFSKITILKISCTVVNRNFEAMDVDPSELTSPEKFTFCPILNYLILSSNRIEKLKLSFPLTEFSKHFIRRIFEALTALTRLTELSIKMRGVPQLDCAESFLHSKQLKSLEYCMDINCSSEQFLLHLLHSNPNLQFLKVSFFKVFKASSNFFEKLISSCLKSLVIDDHLVRDCELPKISPRNIILRHLAIHNFLRSESDVTFFLLQYFQNLRHLIVYIRQDDVFLQFLFGHQTKLRSLILHEHGVSVIEDPLPRNFTCYSLARLSNLEYLELSLLTPVLFPKFFSAESVSTKLKYLRLKGCSKVVTSDLLASLDRMPFLEAFSMHGGCDYFDVWLQICLKLKRLRYLHMVEGLRKFRDSDYRQLFTIRPSLRAVVHHAICGRLYASYFFNTLKKEVHLKEGDYVYPLCRPKVGKFVVEWMDF